MILTRMEEKIFKNKRIQYNYFNSNLLKIKTINKSVQGLFPVFKFIRRRRLYKIRLKDGTTLICNSRNEAYKSLKDKLSQFTENAARKLNSHMLT